MSASFTVLASGSAGNAAFVRDDGFGLLIDCGIGVRAMENRLKSVGRSWADVDAVALTHTHSDHWCESSLAQLAARRIPVFCHATHTADLRTTSPAFSNLLAARLVEHFDRDFSPGGAISLRPARLNHDSNRTFGFRIERTRGPSWAIGYAADLGSFNYGVVGALCEVDILAIEFNHDEQMQRGSGRPAKLIERVLGPRGHLSNSQGADLASLVIRRSIGVKPRYLVPLHLSRQCNRPTLVEAMARIALLRSDHAAEVVMTQQSSASCTMTLNGEPTLFDVRPQRDRIAQPADA